MFRRHRSRRRPLIRTAGGRPVRLRPGQVLPLLAAALLLAGCVAAAQPEPGPAPPPPAAPDPPAEVRLHLPVDPATLDPAQTAEAALLDVVGNLMEGLVAPDGAPDAAGGAAERWESADGRQFTFYLRPEARWSDGKPVTAGDFVRGWLHLLDPEAGAVNAHLLYEVAGAEAYAGLDPAAPDFREQAAALREAVQVKALDDRRLQVTLRAPNPAWPLYTAHPALAPRRADLPFGAVTNGPFVLVHAGPALAGPADGRPAPMGAAGSAPVTLRLEPNPHYWNRQAVRLDAVVYHVEPDPQEALRLFHLGYLHLVLLPADLAAETPGAQAMAQPATMGLVFNTGQPRLADSDLRGAIALALDVERVTAEAVGEAGLPARTLVPPSLAGGWPPGAGAPPPGTLVDGLWSEGSLVGELLSGARAGDALQEARRLWADARARLGLDQITLSLLHAEEAAPLARAVKRSLEARLDGLAVELHTVPFALRLERVRLGQFDLVLQGWVAEHDDPLVLLAPWTTAHPGNAARWVGGEYDALLAAAAAAAGPAREAALEEAERLLLAEAPVVPVYHPVRHWAVHPELQGLAFRPLGARFDLRHAWLDPAAPGR